MPTRACLAVVQKSYQTVDTASIVTVTGNGNGHTAAETVSLEPGGEIRAGLHYGRPTDAPAYVPWSSAKPPLCGSGKGEDGCEVGAGPPIAWLLAAVGRLPFYRPLRSPRPTFGFTPQESKTRNQKGGRSLAMKRGPTQDGQTGAATFGFIGT
jgi:hypothetical protein